MSTLAGEIHGHPTGFPPNRHHGDLGNIERVVNMAHVNIVDPVTTLFKVDRHGMSTMADPGYVGGRSLVLHELIDQFTGPTGYAGDKLGCCHISYPCMPGNVPAGDGTCRPHGWCGDDAHEDDSGNCVCNDPDLDYIDGECVISVPSCPEFSFWDTMNNMCVCYGDLVLHTSASDQSYCACPDNYQMTNSGTEFECICIPGTTGCSGCPDGMEMFDDQCRCEHPYYYEVSGICKCYDHVRSFDIFDASGKCQCPFGHTFNQDTERCDRDCDAFDFINWKCNDEDEVVTTTTTTTTEKPLPTVDPNVNCDNVAVNWRGTKWSKIVYRSETGSVILHVNIANNDGVVDVQTGDFVGLFLFTKKMCGINFVKEIWNPEKISFKIYDIYHKYTIDNTYVKVNKAQTNSVIQYRSVDSII